MSTVADLLDVVEKVNLKEVIDQSINDTKEDYIRLNTEQQLFKGLATDGRQLQPLYKSNSYAKKKNAMNPIPGFGVPDLKLTGSFYANQKLSVQGDEIMLDSDVNHTQYLEKNYGADKIFGLDDENQEEYNFGAFQNALTEKITDQTGLQFK